MADTVVEQLLKGCLSRSAQGRSKAKAQGKHRRTQ